MIYEQQLPQELHISYGTFLQRTFVEQTTGKQHIALALGAWCENDPVPVRIHSECLTGDVFGSARCDCGDQLKLTLEMFQSWGVGLLIYLRQEGRGIGLVNKIRAYELQDQGLDTVDANLALGFSADDRSYDFVPDILSSLDIGSVQLLTNNPDKILSLKNLGVNVMGRIPIEPELKPESADYMRAKMERMGHILSPMVVDQNAGQDGTDGPYSFCDGRGSKPWLCCVT
ncbi:MAG: GTP cyclohydrolase II [Chloroflexota bacterium]|nr:GTP cyclohydrolase II [Chloroflexota bacterium]